MGRTSRGLVPPVAWALIAGLAAAVTMGPTTELAAQNPADLSARDKTEVFIQHLVKVSKLDPQRFQALVLEYEMGNALEELLHEAEGHEGDAHEDGCCATAGQGAGRAGFIERALREIHPRLDEALGLCEKDAQAARPALRDLTGDADPYLAAHAGIALAELDLAAASSPRDADALEAVRERCERIVAKDRLYLADDYRPCLAIAKVFEALEKPLEEGLQYALLLTDYVDVPPAIEAQAKERLAALAEQANRPLGTLASWMRDVERLLEEEETGADPTQAKEGRILLALDKLIELQEARERKSCSSCGGSCKGGCKNGRPKGNRSQSPANVSALGPAKPSVLLHGVSRADPSTIWGLLKETEGARALQSFRGKLPPRYEQLLEQYYKNLSKSQ